MDLPDVTQIQEFYQAYSGYINAAGLIGAGYLLKTLRYSMTKKHWTAVLSDDKGVSRITLKSRFGRRIARFYDPDKDKKYRTKPMLHKEAVSDAVRAAESDLEARLRPRPLTQTTEPEPTEGQ